MNRDPYFEHATSCAGDEKRWQDASIVLLWRNTGEVPPEVQLRDAKAMAALAEDVLESLQTYPHPNEILMQRVRRSAEMVLKYADLCQSELPRFHIRRVA